MGVHGVWQRLARISEEKWRVWMREEALSMVMRWMVRTGCNIMFISNHSYSYLKEDLT